MNCSTCKYWKQWKPMADGTPSKLGNCWFNPPTVIFNPNPEFGKRALSSERPDTWQGDYCGHFAEGQT